MSSNDSNDEQGESENEYDEEEPKRDSVVEDAPADDDMDDGWPPPDDDQDDDEPPRDELEVTDVLSPRHSSDGFNSQGSSGGASPKMTTSTNVRFPSLEDQDEDEEEEGQGQGQSEEEDEEEWKIHENADFTQDLEDDEEQEDGLTSHTGLEIEYLHDKRTEFETGETPTGQSEVQLLEDILNSDNDLSVVPSEDSFLKFIMHIPEQPAEQRLSQEATDTRPLRGLDPVYPFLECSSRPQFDFDYESGTEPRINQCPSIESVFRQHNFVDVHLYLFPGKRMISRDCRIDVNVFKLKMAISRFVHVPPDLLDLRRKRNLVADNKTLAELGAKTGKKMKFVVDINRRLPGKKELRFPKEAKDNEYDGQTSSVRFVNFSSRDLNGRVRKVRREVTIVHPVDPKPMLGGFYDKRNSTTYHHASTSPEDFDDHEWLKSDLHHSTQTYFESENETQTMSEKAVQMERQDYYVSEKADKVIYPRKYYSSDYWEEKRANAANTIQRYWRRWLAVKEKKRRLEGLIKRVEWAECIRKGRIEQRMKVMEEELQRQQNPTSLLDLELLYRAINAWREEEEAYVKSNRWGAERKAALAMLADMEADLLLELEKTKTKILTNGRENYMHHQFLKMSNPRRWLGAKSGAFISYDTEGRVKARHLHDIYKALLEPVQNTPEAIHSRMELLRGVNYIVKEKTATSKIAEMLVDLVGREIRFITAKCSAPLMAGVRKRIANTFYCLCKDPYFNAEAQRIEKIPWDTMKLRKDMIQCKGCRRMQYRDEFTIVRGTTLTTRCHTCMGLYRTAILRIDLNLYRQTLKELRRDEYQAGVVNSVAFLIDAFDVRFLIEQIWHGQSALSGIDNRYLLRLCRWKKENPWAPWNSVLLTEEEAVAHLQLESPEQAYQESFFHKVLVKQTTAKIYFEGLAKFGVGLDERIAESCGNMMKTHHKAEVNKRKFKRKAKAIGLFQSVMLS